MTIVLSHRGNKMYSFVLYSGIWDNKLSMKGLGFHNAWWSNFKDGLPVVQLWDLQLFHLVNHFWRYLVRIDVNSVLISCIQYSKKNTELQDRRPKYKSDLKFTYTYKLVYFWLI